MEIPFSSQTGVSIEEVMLKDLKEISDGEIKVAISTVYMTLEVRVNLNNLVGKQPVADGDSSLTKVLKQLFSQDYI